MTTIALGSLAMALLWPNWRDELHAENYGPIIVPIPQDCRMASGYEVGLVFDLPDYGDESLGDKDFLVCQRSKGVFTITGPCPENCPQL